MDVVLPTWYDDWKTACCERWPNCRNCPFDEDDDEDEDEEDDDQ